MRTTPAKLIAQFAPVPSGFHPSVQRSPNGLTTMDGQVIHIMNTNEVEGLADPSLQQYECSLYTEKGRINQTGFTCFKIRFLSFFSVRPFHFLSVSLWSSIDFESELASDLQYFKCLLCLFTFFCFVYFCRSGLNLDSALLVNNGKSFKRRFSFSWVQKKT